MTKHTEHTERAQYWVLSSVRHHRVLVTVTLCDASMKTSTAQQDSQHKEVMKGAQLPERHQENGTLSLTNGEVASGTFSHILGLKSVNAEQVTIISNQDQKKFHSATYPVKCWLRDLSSKYHLPPP